MESHRQRPPAEQPAQSADALTLEQVEAVLRRAVQLEQRKHVPDAAGLSREELTRAVYETLDANGMTDGVHVRLMCTRGVKRGSAHITSISENFMVHCHGRWGTTVR